MISLTSGVIAYLIALAFIKCATRGCLMLLRDVTAKWYVTVAGALILAQQLSHNCFVDETTI